MYKPSHQVAWESSPMFAVRQYRNPETISREELFEEFIDWIKYESDMSDKAGENLTKFLQPLVNKFLQLDPDKAKAGEQELLERWIKASLMVEA